MSAAKPPVTAQKFTVLIPQRETEGFWVDSVDYTRVPGGQRVTVLLRGKYFSPLTGVPVESLPLKRAVALARHESEDTTNENPSKEGRDNDTVLPPAKGQGTISRMEASRRAAEQADAPSRF